MKRFLGLLLIALMMLSMLFVSVSCKAEPEQHTPDRSESWDAKTKSEHCDPILPAGSVSLNGGDFSIPMTWSADAKGLKGLPDVKYSFAGAIDSTTNVSEALKEAVLNTPQSFFDDTPKNIIFLFSDGWGVTEVNASREYKGELLLDYLPYATESKTDSYKKYSFDDKGDNSNNTNYSSHITTDSCAGGTQVLTGYKTRYGYMGLDVDANPVMNLIEAAHAKGWKTANVTNDNIMDATPSAAMIHHNSRPSTVVLAYKAFMYALVEKDLDLLMGWNWYTDIYTTADTATYKLPEKLKKAEIAGIDQAIKEQKISSTAHSDPIDYFESLEVDHQYKLAPFSVYYTIYEYEDPDTRRNAFMKWPTDDAKLNDYIDWLKDEGTHTESGLTAAIENLNAKLLKGEDTSTKVKEVSTFKKLVNNTDFSKPILGSWDNSGGDYDSSKPNRGYLLSGSVGKKYPSWPEMVAYTIYQMDNEADEAGTGFFCIIENTCTDGWGHAQKPIEMMNEVQCFDEGVAIAVKYVLEHPDTLLVISSDHETGGIVLREGWEDNISLMKSTTDGHSSQNVPLYAFGAGAQNFSAEAINTKYGSQANAGVEENGKVHEGWITGALMGELITGEAFGLTGNTTYNGQPFSTSGKPSGKRLWESVKPRKE